MFFKTKASLSPLPRSDDGDKETRRRRRLSKPLTNKSSTNLFILSAQQSEGQVNNSSNPDVSSAFLATPPAGETAVSVAHSPASESKPDNLPAKSPRLENDVWQGTTFILSQDPVEGIDSQTLLSSMEPVKARRPLSAIFTTPRFSSIRPSFAQRRASLQALAESGSEKAEKNRSAATLPLSSDTQPEALSPRIHRRSSFTPGVATRTSRTASLGPPPEEEQRDPAHDYYYNPTLSEESPLSQLELLDFDEEWAPPAPPMPRSETPSDLDYTHLGGLRLGSLRVVNGRASPVPSELSRHLTGASTPNLKRDASSEYGDGDEGALITLASLRLKSYRGRDQGLQDSPPVPRRPVPAPLRTQSDTLLLPKRDKTATNARLDTKAPASSGMLAPKVDTPRPQISSYSPNKTSELAMAYMAELSASPYSDARPPSTAESVLKSTSKATEFDDDLFEDDTADVFLPEDIDHCAPDIQSSSIDAVWVYEDSYQMSVKRSRDTSPRSSLQPSNSTGSSVKQSDSGYGSKISLESSKDQNHGAHTKTESTAPTEIPVNAGAVDIETRRGRPEPRPISMPLRPSILKRSGDTAPQLPNFSNLYPSTTSLATIKSTSSASSDAPAKLRKLQKRARPRSQPPPVRQIVLQGDHRDISNSDIPPIPVEVAANLAIRTEQVPELGHTFSSMHHTREAESSPKPAYAPAFIDFPKPDSSPHGSPLQMDVPAPPPHRTSFMNWSKGERRNCQRRASSGISEDDAMAIIHDLGTAVSSMGGSPYDIASKTTRPAKAQTAKPQTTYEFCTNACNAPRPKTMMDDATATELARLRSKSIAERDNVQWSQRRSSFNDRGGIPGRNMRVFSAAGDAPPLPPIPSHEQVRQKEVRKADYQRPYLETRATERMVWPEQFSSDPYGSGALPSHYPPQGPIELESQIPPPPPSHSPLPRSIELGEDTPAPPPPSHSPRPRSIQTSDGISNPPTPSRSPSPMSVGPQEDVTNIWAAQASVWKSRRKSIGEMLRSRTAPPDQQYHIQPLATPEPATNDSVYPEIPLRPQKSFTTGLENYRTSDLHFAGAQAQSIRYDSTSQSRPLYSSFASEGIDRSRSRVSQAPGYPGSYVPLAEELYPQQLSRPQPPPQFGRYSGGLNYGYEHGAGFGGSAGTRSVSGVAKAPRKGVPLSESFGVDLSDVPIFAGIRRKPVG